MSVNGQQSTVNGQLEVVNSQDCETLLSKRYLKSYWNSGLTVLAQPLPPWFVCYWLHDCL